MSSVAQTNTTGALDARKQRLRANMLRYLTSERGKINRSLVLKRYSQTPKSKEYQSRYRISAARRVVQKRYKDTPRGRALYRECQRRRFAARINRTPVWADREKIKQIYLDAAELTLLSGVEFSVDHVLPLQAQNVSGLHVHENLQIILGVENSRKCNRWSE